MKKHLYTHWKKYSILLLLLAGLIVYGSTKYTLVFDPIDSKHSVKKIFGEEAYGFGLQVTNEQSTNKDKEYGRLFQKNITDEFNVNFTSSIGKERDFIMKVFYNYEEVNFKVRDGKKFTAINSSYEFKLNNNEEINLPVVIENIISSNDEHGKLVVSIFDNSIYAKDYEELTNFYGMSVAYDIIYTEKLPQAFTPIIGVDLFQKPTTIVTERFPESILQGMMVTNEFNLDKYDKGIPFPPNKLQVKSGEEIELAYVASDPNGGEDTQFVIISLLGWQQVEMNDNRFLPVKLEPNHTALGSFKIHVPDQAGLYEFVALMLPVTNRFPTSPSELEEGEIATAYRFTVEVIFE